MADVSERLNTVADRIRALAAALGPLVTENRDLRARVAELEGEDAAESAAADNVENAYAELAADLNGDPDAPDVPAEVGDAETEAGEPGPDAGAPDAAPGADAAAGPEVAEPVGDVETDQSGEPVNR